MRNERIEFDFFVGAILVMAHVDCEVGRIGGYHDGYSTHDFGVPVVDLVWIDENTEIFREGNEAEFEHFDQLAMIECEKQEIRFAETIDDKIAGSVFA